MSPFALQTLGSSTLPNALWRSAMHMPPMFCSLWGESPHSDVSVAPVLTNPYLDTQETYGLNVTFCIIHR